LTSPAVRQLINGLLDYADEGPDPQVRALQYNSSQTNLGVGGHDIRNAFSRDNNGYTFRALEAGPIGRRFFINTRLTMS
jgi:hypothetical protein